MTIGELKNILEDLSNMQDYEILNVYINNKKVSVKDLKLRIDNGYADLFLENKNMTTFILNFRCRTLEEWEKDNTIIGDKGIAIIDYPDGYRKVVIGDGITKCLDCKELKKFPKSVKIEYYGKPKEEPNSFVKINEDDCV